MRDFPVREFFGDATILMVDDVREEDCPKCEILNFCCKQDKQLTLISGMISWKFAQEPGNAPTSSSFALISHHSLTSLCCLSPILIPDGIWAIFQPTLTSLPQY